MGTIVDGRQAGAAAPAEPRLACPSAPPPKAAAATVRVHGCTLPATTAVRVASRQEQPASSNSCHSSRGDSWGTAGDAPGTPAHGSGAAAPHAQRREPADAAAQQRAQQQQQHQDEDEADSGATLRHRTLAFVRHVARSPTLQSALLSVELSGTHPPPRGGIAPSTLEWTLAQLLALHLRTGEAEATEGSALASLWLLLAAQAPAPPTAASCLSAWLQHLPLFAPELVASLADDWETNALELEQGLEAAQMRLLRRLRGCSSSLDLDAEVWPCLRQLFSLSGPPPPATPATPAAALAGQAGQPWAHGMHAYCALIRQQASLLKEPRIVSAAADSARQTPDCADEQPAKQQRLH